MAAILGRPCLVNGGGDVFASGRPHDAPAWRVGVADPFRPDHDIAVLEVSDRGVATSSTLRRRWQAGGQTLHHLIDPRTGGPATGDAVQVTTIAESALEAEYHAKVALLLGAAGGLKYLNDEAGIGGLIVREDGSLLRSAGLGEYLTAG
jgi:thiamine biosynthesis lipoprotein